MSVCVAFNLSDGVVIAVDTATTITDANGSISKVFLDSDKLFQLGNLKVGIATYGVAALHGRTIGSYVREFSLDPTNGDLEELDLRTIVERLRVFFFGHYKSFAESIHQVPFDEIPVGAKGNLGLVVGGFSAGSFQSELWEIVIPVHDVPHSAHEIYPVGNFGYAWFASSMPINRYLKGFDVGLIIALENTFTAILERKLTAEETQKLIAVFGEYEYHIKTDGMPIQSGIACAKFLVDFVLGHYRFAETHPIVEVRLQSES